MPCLSPLWPQHERTKTIKSVVVIRPLPRDGGMTEDHGAPEAGQLPGPGPQIVETESRQRA